MLSWKAIWSRLVRIYVKFNKLNLIDYASEFLFMYKYYIYIIFLQLLYYKHCVILLYLCS